MKPILLKVPVAPMFSYRVRHNVRPAFYQFWHYHPELELTYIKQGTGTRFVGDNIERFRPGDLTFLGSNLPHVWRSDASYFKEGNEEVCESMVIHFPPDLFSQHFLELPELEQVKSLLTRAHRGMRITGITNKKISELIHIAYDLNGIDRIIILLRILKLLSLSQEVSYICNIGFTGNTNESDTKRLNDIYTYTLANFSNKINLKDVASIANMTPNALCRYFKNHTRKTYSKFLQEIRVSHACKLLLEDKLSISQICLECGYQDWSNFTRYFKAIKNQTPSQFIKAYRTK